MEGIIKDLRYSVRTLVRRPGFTLIAVIALALGIGANTAIFSVVNAVLLEPLPFAEPERLVIINETVRRETVEPREASYLNFVDWREQNQSFDYIAVFVYTGFNLTGGEEPVRVRGEVVSASYFPLMGIEAHRGRTFQPEEDATPLTHPVAIISHALWQRRFASDPGAVGSNIRLNEKEFTVVGIAPEGFLGISTEAEVWVPMMMAHAFFGDRTLTERGSRSLSVAARLKPGVSIAQAQADMDTITGRLESAYPNSNKDRGAQVRSAHEVMMGDMRPTLMVLLGAVAFVLLIACGNVANLLLARAASRHKEIAIRTALGARRSRLVGQLLTESVTLAIAGGGAGLLLAAWGIDLLVAFLGDQVPQFVRVGIDARVLAFTLAVSVLTGMIFGIVPALQASKPDLNEALKEGTRGSTGGARRNRTRRLLVVSEIAMALMLLVCAGLMLRSFQQLQSFDPGFKIDGIISMRVILPRSYSEEQVTDFSRRFLGQVRGLAGLGEVGLGSNTPLDGNSSATYALVEGVTPPDNTPRVYYHRISPGFFSALGIPMREGRDFSDGDDARGRPVAIISSAMAARFWPGESAIGKRISMDEDEHGKPYWLEVVGVVGDVKYRTLIHDINRDPDIYVPMLQNASRSVSLVARMNGDTAALTQSIRGELQRLDPNLPIYGVQTMRERMNSQTARARFTALLLGTFSVVAMLLAAVGIYGVMAYSVAQRTHEIGIRLALGADRGDVLKMVVGEGMALVGAGVLIGAVAAVAATRAISSELYGVSATDPPTFVVVSLVLAGVALGACFIPALRATRVDPVVALRYE
jgi:putative ABC transport system permease protein